MGTKRIDLSTLVAGLLVLMVPTLSGQDLSLSGSGDPAYIAKFTTTATLHNSVLFEGKGGNIGLGTRSPIARLHVVGNIRLGNILDFGAGNCTLPMWPPGRTLLCFDGKTFDFRVNSARALRLVNPIGASSPSIIGGFSANRVDAAASGATIAGGGEADAIQVVTDNVGTIGGGAGNRAGNEDADPTNAGGATVAGGERNVASQAGATVGGGWSNSADGQRAVVSGGGRNSAIGWAAAVGGGSGDTASGANATVPGGQSNTAAGNYSLAAGKRARALHAGTFVWGDGTDADVASSGDNQFIIRASGGVGIGTTTPGAQLDVRGDIKLGPNDNLFAVTGDEKLLIMTGVVRLDGTCTTSSAFTCQKVGTGNYLVILPTTVGPPILPSVIPFSNLPRIPVLGGVGADRFQIRIFDTSGAGVDTDFYLTVVARRQ